jgi:hypothetical protein
MNIRWALVIFMGFAAIIGSCKKEDPQTKTDDGRLIRSYCNDPQAINYNWDFPGTPDNSVCFYPDEMFKGTYKVFDTSFNADYIKDTTSYREFTITVNPVNKTKLLVSGYVLNNTCTLNNLGVTGNRFFKATVDSLFLPPPDSLFLNGMPVCDKDTISGYLSRTQTNDTLIINFMITMDTGLVFHKGRAIKQ